MKAWQRATAPGLVLASCLLPALWAWPHGVASWRGVGIVSAWVGCGALVASLALMVREPRWSAALGGLEHMYRWHHRSGALGYLALLLHPIALAIDAAAESAAVAWQLLSPWAQGMPERVGWLALLMLMTGLATTFATRLPYRRWSGWHHVLGAGVVLGLLHAGLLLGDDATWLALATATATALVWRWLRSDIGVAALPYRVREVTRLTPQMVETTLAPLGAAMAPQPGQFVLAAFGEGPHYAGCAEFHPFTISAIAASGDLALAIKALGPCTQQLQRLQPDTLVRLQGPFGDFLADSALAPQLWIAGGVGITPFIARLRQGPVPQPVHLIYLVRGRNDAAFVDELEIHARSDPGFTMTLHVDRGPPPDADALLAAVPALAQREVQLCGPPPLVTALKAALARHGVAPGAIHSESFDFR